MRTIDADALKGEKFYSHERHENCVSVYAIDMMPTIEPERPHGEWIPINIHEETWDYKCSVCGAEVDIDFPNCPYCLADMQKKEGEEK